MNLFPFLALAAQSTPRAGNLFFPEEGSTVARQIDDVFYFILWVSIISFVLCIGAGVWFMWKYREREGHQMIPTPSHSTRLEITWTIVPTILVAIMFWVGFDSFLHLREAPSDSYEIEVIARQWSWEFRYPNGAVDEHLHVPVGKPVKLIMTSTDVLHSLFIPAFRVKQDVVPGRYTTLWFEALRTNADEDTDVDIQEDRDLAFDLFCTEYCGQDHSFMNRKVFVYPQDQYDAIMREKANWLGKAGDLTPAQKGERLYQSACISCHLPTGETKIGPGFLEVSTAIASGTTTLEFENAPNLIPDENYLRESILVPGAKVRKGFPNQMNSFQGQLDDKRIAYLITYIKSLADPQIGAEYETLEELTPAPAGE